MDEKKLKAFVDGYDEFHKSLSNILNYAYDNNHLTLIESV